MTHITLRMNAVERYFQSPRLTCMRGMDPSFKQERDMNKFNSEVRELDIDQLDSVSGGDMALNIAVKAYEAMCQRVVDAAHQPITQPTSPMHF